jgi:hypothetical protein
LIVIRLVTAASTLVGILAAVRDCLGTRAALQIEVLTLRHQLNVLQCSVKRPKLTAGDRYLWVRFWTALGQNISPQLAGRGIVSAPDERKQMGSAAW